MTFKQLVFNIVIILAAFSLVGWTAGPQAWHHCTGQWNIGPVPLAELALPEEGEHGKYAELTQFDVVQNPFVAKVNVLRFDHFLMVRPNHADDLKELDDSVLLMCSGQKGAQGVAEQVESGVLVGNCLLYTSPSPRDATLSRMPSSA